MPDSHIFMNEAAGVWLLQPFVKGYDCCFHIFKELSCGRESKLILYDSGLPVINSGHCRGRTFKLMVKSASLKGHVFEAVFVRNVLG